MEVSAFFIFLYLEDVEMKHVVPLSDIFPLFVSIFTIWQIDLLAPCVKFESRFCSVNCAQFALFSVITLLLHFLRTPETSPNYGIFVVESMKSYEVDCVVNWRVKNSAIFRNV